MSPISWVRRHVASWQPINWAVSCYVLLALSASSKISTGRLFIWPSNKNPRQVKWIQPSPALCRLILWDNNIYSVDMVLRFASFLGLPWLAEWNMHSSNELAIHGCKKCIDHYQPYICLQLQHIQHANSAHVFDCTSIKSASSTLLIRRCKLYQSLGQWDNWRLAWFRKITTAWTISFIILCKASKMKKLPDHLVFILHVAMPGVDARPVHDCKTAAVRCRLNKIVAHQNRS